MSNLERRKRIDELKERLFFEIKDQGLGGGGSSYGAPEIPSYNAPAPAPVQQPPSYSAPAPSYGAPSLPSYGQFDGFMFNKGPGKVIEIPVPNLPIPDPIQFKAGVLRSKGRIASGLLHTKAGLLRAGANILAQKANALDKFAQAIPAIKANLINSIQGLGGGKGGGGGGYGAPQPPPSYNAPAPAPVQQQQQPPPAAAAPSYSRPASNSGGFPASVQAVSQTFRPSSSGDSYGSPQAGVITAGGPAGAVAVSSTLTFGNSGVNPRQNPSGPAVSSTASNGFSPLTQSTFDQVSGGRPPKRNVFSGGGGGVRPGQLTTLTLNSPLPSQTGQLQLQQQVSSGSAE